MIEEMDQELYNRMAEELGYNLNDADKFTVDFNYNGDADE